MVRPHLDYYIYLWQSYLRKNKNVEKEQRKVTKIARGIELLHSSQEIDCSFLQNTTESFLSERYSKAMELGVMAECKLKIIIVSKIRAD